MRGAGSFAMKAYVYTTQERSGTRNEAGGAFSLYEIESILTER